MSQYMRRMVPKEYYTNHFSQITFRTSFENCVLKALVKREWVRCQSAGLLQWFEKERVNDVFEEGLTAKQRVNHFRLYTQLCRKDMVIKNIRKHKRDLKKKGELKDQDWDFLPLTYFLPSEYTMFEQEFKNKGGLWIMKPTSKCQGQGIFLIDKLAQVAPYRRRVTQLQKQPLPLPPKPSVPSHKVKKKEESDQDSSDSDISQKDERDNADKPAESYIIQRYIHEPLLFGNKKFDLRIYALCTKYSQLTVWLYRSGFARFTHEPYDTENIGNLESHLTNVEIQKHSKNYDQARGGKWLIDRLKHYMQSRYNPIQVDGCFTAIKDIIIRSLQSVQQKILSSKNSFELYGYDFMIDRQLKPWLIEINGGPSMTANTDFDCKLKCGLIDDVLTIVDMEGIRSGQEMTVGGFDLIIDKDVKVHLYKRFEGKSTLGFRNEREKVIKKIVDDFIRRKICSKDANKENVGELVKKDNKPEQQRHFIARGMPNYKKGKTFELEDRASLLLELKLLQKEGEKGNFTPLHSEECVATME